MPLRPTANQVRFRLAFKANQTSTPLGCRLESVVSPKVFRLRRLPRRRLKQMHSSPNRRSCPPPPRHPRRPLPQHPFPLLLNQRQPRFRNPHPLNGKLKLLCLNPRHLPPRPRRLNPLNRLRKREPPTSRCYHLPPHRHRRLHPSLNPPLPLPLRRLLSQQCKLHPSDSNRLG